MPPSLSLRFTTHRFDHTSELPEAYNAGNRFYGRDVAEWLAAELTARGFPSDLLDEDWGWLVFATKDAPHDLEIAVYHLEDDEENATPASPEAEWGLWLRAHETRKRLGLFTSRVEVPVPERFAHAVREAIVSIGARAERWEDGPADG
jgi:hypothetical protein